jgi:lipoteichoic acid synthase
MDRMKDKIKAGFQNNWKEMAACGVFPLMLEVLLHLLVYEEMTVRMVYPCIFALTAGCGLFILSTLWKEQVNRVVFLVCSSVITLYFEIQFVYNSIFGEFMSFWQFSFGAEALANFWQQMFYGIWKALPEIILLLVPQVILFLVVIGRKDVLRFQKCRWPVQLSALGVLVVLHLSALGIMAANNNNAFSAFRLYQNPNTATEISVKNIGLLSTARLECKYLILSSSGTTASASYYSDGETVQLSASEMQKKNMLNIDFDALAEETDDETLKSLDAYFAQQKPTAKNQYTGLFQGYNLITICAESFSPYLIDKELTPALYELSTNGFVFENYFGSYGSNTTNGEYSFCMGLYPDLSRNKSMASFYASQNNYLPFCLGNEFKNQGAQTWAYHNYTGEYYSRNVTHPNMGYTFKAAGEGLDMELNWPTSDLEMMEKSVDDYINSGEQFCAYYMTFSGHFQYNWENPMSLKNRSVVEDLPYSETVKAYIACNLELEYALEYLMDRLEEAGIADQTVIVLTNDHYPYGLSEAEYNQLAGEKVDTTFDKYRSSFICYVPDVCIPVETYCSTVDILPTLLNLFGLPYDSRLLAGKDVLSADADNYAVLSDQSFITPDFAFDTSTGSPSYFSDELDREEADAQILEIQEEIADRFHVSADMLGSDYYAHALLGKAEGGSEVESYAFTDITNSISIGMLDYLYGNGYMDPVSDTLFGFDETCTYAEFLDVLYRISGSPDVSDVTSVTVGSAKPITGEYAPAVYWARENELINPAVTSMDAATPLTRKSISVTLYAYAGYRGLDTRVDQAKVDEYAERYSAFTELEAQAITWCFDHAVIRSDGTLESVFEAAGAQMNRRQVVISVYNYHLYVLS